MAIRAFQATQHASRIASPKPGSFFCRAGACRLHAPENTGARATRPTTLRRIGLSFGRRRSEGSLL
ncbi:MAG: hypothetical protein WBF00_13590, partial [Methylocella sp.]